MPGTYTSAAGHTSGAIVGDSAGAVSGSGTGALAMSSASGLPVGPHARSLEAWFKTSTTTTQTVVSYGAYGNNFMIYLYGGTLWIYNGAEGSVTSHLATSPEDGNWHYVVVTYDGGTTGTIYLDGQEVGQGSFYAPLTDTAGYPLEVGADPYGNAFNLDHSCRGLRSREATRRWCVGRSESRSVARGSSCGPVRMRLG
jgi:hypothetical protein